MKFSLPKSMFILFLILTVSMGFSSTQSPYIHGNSTANISSTSNYNYCMALDGLDLSNPVIEEIY